jgi:hypothetical protein
MREEDILTSNRANESEQHMASQAAHCTCTIAKAGFPASGCDQTQADQHNPTPDQKADENGAKDGG